MMAWIGRSLEVAALLALTALAVKFGVVCVHGTEQERHRRAADRIDEWISRAWASPPPGLDPMVWRNCLNALHTDLANPLWYARNDPHHQLPILADELDATGGSDLADVRGIFVVANKLAAIQPLASDWGMLAELRQEYPNEAAAAEKPK